MKKTAKAKDFQRKREMIGVALFALAIFVGFCVYTDAEGLIGKWAGGFIFGLFGIFAYLSPLFVAIAGVLSIASNGKHVHAGKISLVGGIAIMLAAFVHLFTADLLADKSFVGYVWGSFTLGETSRTGGGLFGGLLSFPSILLLGKTGSMILFATGILICLLVLTNISIKKTSEKIGFAFKETHDTIVERRKERAQARALYLESLENAEAAADAKDGSKKKGRVRKKSDASDVDIFPTSGPIRKRNSPDAFAKEEAQNAAKLRLLHGRKDAYPFDLFGENADSPDIDELPADADLSADYANDKDDAPFPAQRPYLVKKRSDNDAPWDTDAVTFTPSVNVGGQGAGFQGSGDRDSEVGEFGAGVADAFDGADSDIPWAVAPEGAGGSGNSNINGNVNVNMYEDSVADSSNYMANAGGAGIAGNAAGIAGNAAGIGGVSRLGALGATPDSGKPDAGNLAAGRSDPGNPAAGAPAAKAPDSGNPDPGNPPTPYRRPPITLLQSVQKGTKKMEDPRETAQILVDTLASFGISVTVTDITVGPIITRFELNPAPGVRVNRITNLSDDIALRLAAHRVRIEAPIPGKSAIGIEIPNKEKASVLLREIIESKEFMSAESNLTVALGKDIAGKMQVADLSKMPHLLIAGQTGAGKSVCINDIIISLVYKSTPSEVRMILIDPKVVEFQVYETLPHLLVPVVTDPTKAAGALKWAVAEMVRRYQAFAKLGARDLARYNDLMEKKGEERLPQIVIIVDELADLMMVAPDDVEDGICRLAQMGRAAGLHLVVATQRPSSDVITGLIKANIPSRIALAVASATDSRIVLDQGGAEKLLGRGDMLFHPSGSPKPVRAQCAWVSDPEAEALREYFQQNSMQARFDDAITASIANGTGLPANDESESAQFEDELLPKAAEIALDGGQISTSMLQRRLRVGYSRAGRLVDILETMGVISAAEGSKPRRILMTRYQVEQLFGPGDIPAGAYEDSNEG